MENNPHNAQHKPITQNNTISKGQNNTHNAQHNPDNSERNSPTAQCNCNTITQIAFTL